MRNLTAKIFLFLFSFIGFTYANQLTQHIQTIDGAQAFFNQNKTQLITRIGVTPHELDLHKTSNKAIMDQFKVVICTLGQCQFAKPLYGLGFFEASFKYNKSKKTPSHLLAVACSKLGCVAKKLPIYTQTSTVKSIDIKGIKNLYEVKGKNGNIYVSSQPTTESLQEIKKLNIKSFMNLRTLNESFQVSENQIKKFNIKYFTIPVRPQTLTMQDIKDFNSFLNNPVNYPIFIHCASGNRVAMMLAFFDIYSENAPIQAAIEKAKQHGLTSKQLEEFITTFVKKHKQ